MNCSEAWQEVDNRRCPRPSPQPTHPLLPTPLARVSARAPSLGATPAACNGNLCVATATSAAVGKAADPEASSLEPGNASPPLRRATASMASMPAARAASAAALLCAGDGDRALEAHGSASSLSRFGAGLGVGGGRATPSRASSSSTQCFRYPKSLPELFSAAGLSRQLEAGAFRTAAKPPHGDAARLSGAALCTAAPFCSAPARGVQVMASASASPRTREWRLVWQVSRPRPPPAEAAAAAKPAVPPKDPELRSSRVSS
mmetsp:Transcript_116711/g.330151  ORF Transcript_116711/g.330151 Transcript_116711/m.330151 type:complete len:260 (-) Transcript_116711:1559-2338(-)